MSDSLAADPFSLDKFFLNQKVLSLGHKYFVYNEAGAPIFFVDRITFKVRAEFTVYDDETRSVLRLKVTKDSIWTVINQNYTVADSAGQPVGFLRRQGWMSVLRRAWNIHDAQGTLVARAREDSWVKAMLRRIPFVDIIGDFLKTDFLIETPNGDLLGRFLRRFSLVDKYTMDLSADAARMLNRRLAVALAILLDSAESR